MRYHFTEKQHRILKRHILNELSSLTHKENNNGITVALENFKEKKQFPYTIRFTKRDSIRKKCLTNDLRTLLTQNPN